MSKKPKIYYKVVKADTLKSCLTLDEFAVQYKVGEWVKAPTRTKLFVFTNLDYAKSWTGLGWVENCNIYSCHVTNIGEYKWMMSIGWCFARNMRDLKKKIRSKKKIEFSDEQMVPAGTIFAGRVKLLEKMS